MEKKKGIPVLVTVLIQNDEGMSFANDVHYLDKIPPTIEQVRALKNIFRKENRAHTAIILNIIPLRSEEVQGDE